MGYELDVRVAYIMIGNSDVKSSRTFLKAYLNLIKDTTALIVRVVVRLWPYLSIFSGNICCFNQPSGT